jgi:hypothetical protein
MDRAQISNLAGRPRLAMRRHPISGPEGRSSSKTKKRLIEAFGELENRSTYWKQSDCSISKRNKNAICQHASFLIPSRSSLVTGHFCHA